MKSIIVSTLFLITSITTHTSVLQANEQMSDLSFGKKLYGEKCAKCHDAIVQGAPRPSVGEDWHNRSRDVDILVKNVISGPTHMPEKGGTQTQSSGELKSVIGYMLSTVESPIDTNTTVVEPDRYQTLATGKKLYNQLCYSCHDNGDNGAPLVGYMPDWQDRIKLGKDALVESVITGKGMMMPKGGGGMESREKYASIVDYMLAAVQDKEITNSPEMKEQVQRSLRIANGLKLYNQVCFSCHNTGKNGAPQLGNKEAWKDRQRQDVDTLVQHTIDGHGLMGEKGGSAIKSIEGVKSMVMYMLSTVNTQ